MDPRSKEPSKAELIFSNPWSDLWFPYHQFHAVPLSVAWHRGHHECNAPILALPGDLAACRSAEMRSESHFHSVLDSIPGNG